MDQPSFNEVFRGAKTADRSRAPAELSQTLWFDCSPMRPTAWAQEEADHWYDAWDVPVAIKQGRADREAKLTAESEKTDKRAAIAATFDEEDE